jgi:deoxyribodipyrimidine photolyase
MFMQLFESLLMDCDVAVNYANWNYFAGLCTGTKNRKFDTVAQGERYDANACLAQTWLPELCKLPVHLRHRPWLASSQDDTAEGHSQTVKGSFAPPLVPVESQTGADTKAMRNRA